LIPGNAGLLSAASSTSSHRREEVGHFTLPAAICRCRSLPTEFPLPALSSFFLSSIGCDQKFYARRMSLAASRRRATFNSAAL
jgi:hypothetical protein